MTLVDSNILIDIINEDPVWMKRSRAALDTCKASGGAGYVDIVFAEISLGFSNPGDVEAFLSELNIRYMPMSPAALHRAGRAFLAYRKQGGNRTGVLPDFFIGAQAAAEKIPLLTRDPARYRVYFPDVEIVAA